MNQLERQKRDCPTLRMKRYVKARNRQDALRNSSIPWIGAILTESAQCCGSFLAGATSC